MKVMDAEKYLNDLRLLKQRMLSLGAKPETIDSAMFYYDKLLGDIELKINKGSILKNGFTVLD